MAAQLGGFLAVSYVAEHVFAGALEAVWRTKWDEALGPASWSADTPVGPLQASGAMALMEKPGFRFDGASNRVAVTLRVASRFDVTLGGVRLGGVYVGVDAQAALPVTVKQEAAFKKAVVDMSAFTLDLPHVQLTWFDGPMQGNGNDAVTSEAARAAMAAELRRLAQPMLTFRVPTDEVFVMETALASKGTEGRPFVTPQLKVGGVRVLDG